MQYTTAPEADFSYGIDARSSENQLLDGFVKDLLNADIVERRVRTRKGYQGFAGNVQYPELSMDLLPLICLLTL
jgi:hypothetical protein